MPSVVVGTSTPASSLIAAPRRDHREIGADRERLDRCPSLDRDIAELEDLASQHLFERGPAHHELAVTEVARRLPGIALPDRDILGLAHLDCPGGQQCPADAGHQFLECPFATLQQRVHMQVLRHSLARQRAVRPARPSRRIVDRCEERRHGRRRREACDAGANDDGFSHALPFAAVRANR
jgi:hypothetical protein